MDIYVVYSDEKQIELLKNTDIKGSPYFHLINDQTFKGKKEAWKVKSSLSARLSPFAAIYENDKPIKAFYSEADDNIIQSLINYLNE